MASTEVVPVAKTIVKKKEIKDLLSSEQFRAAVAAALPRHMKVERFIRVALNATLRQPDLLNCNQQSFFKAMLDLSAYGLEADGRRAHLIPFRNNKTNSTDVQLIIDYKGIAELVRRSGDVSYMHADVVRESDDFSFSFGSDAHLRHRPNLSAGEDKQRVVAIYSYVRLKDGNDDFIVLSPAEIETVRKRSRASGSGPWVTDWPEMAKKTAFRRHSKWLPLSAEVREAVEYDDEAVGVDASVVNEVETAKLSLESVKPSADENRGHGQESVAEPEQAQVSEA